MAPLRNGVNNSRYVMGWISVIAILTGLRTSSTTSYWKISHVSRAVFIGAGFLPSGEGLGESLLVARRGP